MSPYWVDVCACDDMFFHLPGPRSSLAKTVTRAVSHGLCKWDHSNYHWRKLPQVSFFSWQMFCRESFSPDKRVFVVTKHIFCRDKSMLAVTTFVMTKLYLLWQNIVGMTKALSWQIFGVTNTCLLRQKFCCDKNYTCIAAAPTSYIC